MSIRAHRPSASMVIAIAALVFAVGGTSYAAITLPANSVGSKQLKRGAVTGKKLHARAVTGDKVGLDTLTGVNIRESSLGTVPSATHAANAANAANAAKLDGLAASSLTRIAFTPPTGDVTLTGATTTKNISSLALTAPVNGYVRVSMTGFAIAHNATGCPCVMQGRLRADAGSDVELVDTNLAGDAGDIINSFDRRSYAASTVFPVAAGAHTFTFSILRQAGDATSEIGVSHVVLEAEFIPFDGTGVAPAAARARRPAASAPATASSR